ncbi:SRPBCC family protein [Mycolicibacterium tusciae]|uniref:SRPBCC family protein n=1 Tax=Mycolicibacterium tusciae TaxID=75922 RepID=UPI00024A3B33|nr:SRPBCC family protein [Mycolicibacterium tusciae]
MYLLADAAVDIARSCAEAFDYACDLENFAAWFPGVVEVVVHNDVPFSQRGREYRETVDVPLRGRRSVGIRVVDAEAPHRLVTEGDLTVVMPRMEIHLTESSPQGCTVQWRMFSRNRNALARIAVLPIARVVMTKRAATGLHRLRERLERDRTD